MYFTKIINNINQNLLSKNKLSKYIHIHIYETNIKGKNNKSRV